MDGKPTEYDKSLEQMHSAQREFFSRTRSFTRRGDRISQSLQHTWDKYKGEYIVEVERGFGETTVADNFKIDLKQLFGNDNPLIVEVGCGSGDQIVEYAKNHPEYNFLGFEVWYPGLVKTISNAVKAGVKNLKLVEADAVQAMPIIVPNGSCEQVWTFFPDPWRKKRHHKRRIVNPIFADIVANALVEGGLWRIATDWNDYAWHIRDVIEACPRFENPYKGQNPDPQDEQPERGGFAPRWDQRVTTRFEQRGVNAGRGVHDFVAKKVK